MQPSFVMHASDHDCCCTDDGDIDIEEEADNIRFACDEDGVSLMDKTVIAGEVALHPHGIKEEVRSKVSSLQIELDDVTERLGSLTTKIDKWGELQQKSEREFDLQYRRSIAEALDKHLTAVQRNYEHISLLEERRIRDDAACEEEAKRKEKAIEEEKLWEERIKAEEVAEEAASEHAPETLDDDDNAVVDSKQTVGASSFSVDVKKAVQSPVIKASENALELERRRRQIYEELSAKSKAALKECANSQDFRGRIIGRILRTTSGAIDNVTKRAEALVELINNSPGCAQSIRILLFAEKMVSYYCAVERSPSAIFATCRVIILMTSKVPVAMDILIAELNRVCIYTVPKHIEVFGTSKDAYRKAIGYMEENGNIENDEEYLERLSCYMKLYGALVQTEGVGAAHTNLHAGWAWLARFLNALPANLYTAVALCSFLEMAGYALYRRYKNQFEKLLRIIDHDFLDALEVDDGTGGSWSSKKLTVVKASIGNYIQSNLFKKEPVGLELRHQIKSTEIIHDP